MMQSSLLNYRKTHKNFSFFLNLFLVGIASYLSIRFAYKVGFASNDVVAIWPAAALSYWAVRRFGPWAMLPIFLADALNMVLFLPHLMPFGLINGIGNALAPWLAVLIEQKWSQSENPFANLRSTLASILVAMPTLSIFAAMVGTLFVSTHYHLPLSAASGLLWQWFLSDYTGCLVFVPILFTFPHLRLTTQKKRTLIIDSLVITLSILGVWYVTYSGLSIKLGNYPTVFLTMPAMLWLSLREDTPRVMTGLAALSVSSFIITIQTLDRMGSASWMALQLYIVVVVFSSYIVHALQLERTQLVKTLTKERDILEQRVEERTRELELLATKDGLTGILNRRCFFLTAEKEFKRARGEKPISLILMDIDEFKKINDTFGHAVGDQVMVAITQTITNMIRQGADSFARMGGEEFTLILPETDLSGAVLTAERLRRAIETLDFYAAPISQKNQEEHIHFHCTCSFGVVQWDLNNKDINHALYLADQALYNAKQAGRNQVVRFPEE